MKCQLLKRFQLTWRDANKELGLRPRVALDLAGRKVLLFSDQEVANPADSLVQR